MAVMIPFISDAHATKVEDDFNWHFCRNTRGVKESLSIYIYNFYPYMINMTFFDRKIIYLIKLVIATHCR